MRTTVATFVAALCLFGSVQAFAYRGGGVVIVPPPIVISPGGPAVVVEPAPPPPPPPVYYAPPPTPPPAYYAPVPVVQYQYYPAWNVYLDPISGLYWSLQGGAWVLGPLPPHVHPGRLGRVVVVPGEEGRPWHRVPPGNYKHGW